MTTLRQRRHRRIDIAIRAVAATAGSYMFAAAVAAALPRLLPIAPIDAVVAATLLALALLPVTAIWAFAARSARAAWVGILVPVALLALAGWLAGVPA